MKRNLRNFLLASFLLAGVPLAAHVANADDKSMGMGGGMHGDMGGGMGMVPFGKRAEKLATELKLTPEQRLQWDAQMQKSKSQMEAMRRAHEGVRDAMKAELAKPEPDLAALAAKADAMRDQGRAAHREIRDGWLKLYATMSPEQKGVVKKMLVRHMSMMDRMRNRMEQRHHGADKSDMKDGKQDGNRERHMPPSGPNPTPKS